VFIPKKHGEIYAKKLSQLRNDVEMPIPRVTYLESVLPWEYPSWDRKTDSIV
jgi:hypothetical protein